MSYTALISKDREAYCPAFPCMGQSTYEGLTKREYAAIAAMQGFCANSAWDDVGDVNKAIKAIAQADALLAELARGAE